MARVLLFHHVQGLTDGVQAFADQLRGHRRGRCRGRREPRFVPGVRRLLDGCHAGPAAGAATCGCPGALLYHSAAPLEEFGQAWPIGVPLQMHVMVDDPFEDLPVMQELAASAPGELFTYEGDAHLFTDSSLHDHDPQAARLVLDRTLDFLARLE